MLFTELISVMNKELDIPDPMEKTLKRIKMIKEVCGDLCDTSKEIEPGEFIGSVTAKVNASHVFMFSNIFSCAGSSMNHKFTEKQTNRQTNKQTNRQTDA